MISRRHFLNYSSLAALGLAAPTPFLPAWARSGLASDMRGLSVLQGQGLQGQDFALNVAQKNVNIDGKSGKAIVVNDQLPAPLLRWREGELVTITVRNDLLVDTSIHWHGLLLPFTMDGVPGVSFPGIKPGETFTYQFPIKQAGTYWYHSHSGLQEQAGHYGPIIIEPKGDEGINFDREYVIVLSDWTFENPHKIFANLKKMSDVYNYQQNTLGDLRRDISERGLAAAWSDKMMWDEMRMNPADISDVTAATYTYLLNGHSAADNWTGLFAENESVRLRFINASSMSIFNVRIPGLPLTVVQADGLNVQPVETDEFQIGTAETYDVLLRPKGDRAYTIMAESNDRSGFVRGTLSPILRSKSPNLNAPSNANALLQAHVPSLRQRPILTMKDMAMDHMSHSDAKGSEGHINSERSHRQHKMDGGMSEEMIPESTVMQKHEHVKSGGKGIGVVGLAAKPVNRLSERPLGLEQVAHRVLVYSDLKSRDPNPDSRPPERELELHLTSNMERYMWSFDGIKFSDVDEPIRFVKGERLRLVLVNDTMMPHPIHLHGMFFDVVIGNHQHKPRKHTIVVKPGEKLAVDITADAVGDWVFHCHLLYHMHAGMMRVVSVV